MRNKLFASAKGGISVSWYIAVLFSLFVVATANGTLSASTGTWATKAPIPSASYGLGGAFVGGKFYAISGFATARLGIYDPINNTWTTGVPLPADTGYNLRQYFGTAVLDGKIYVVGGDTGGSGDRATLYRYDPALNSWTTLAPMPLGSRYGLGAASINGKIYAVGGYNMGSSTYLSRLEVYDPLSNTWATKTSMPIPHFGALVGAINGKLFVAGGSNAGVPLTALHVYDPATDNWSTGAPMPFTGNGNGVVLGSKLFSIGAGPSPERRVFAYDASTDSWITDFALMPTGRHDLGVAADEVNNKIYAVGGWNGSYVSALEVFTPPPSPNATPPSVTTGSATSITPTSATLNGTVNANGLSTTAWFQYGTTSGSYSSTSTTQSVSGSSDTTVSIDVSGLSSSTTYYYRIAASSSAGTSYGSETTLTTLAPPNTAPVANAGADQTAYVGNTVTLDGSGSTDVDGNLLTYSWSFNSKPTGSTATLSDATAVKPTFTVDKAGTYVVSLMVNDGTLNSAAATLTISTLNSAPVANAGTDQTPFVNDTVTLNGSGSYDVDGNTLTFTWAFTSKPADSTATLSDAAAVKPTFMVDKAGMYVVSLIVNDGMVDSSAADTVTISTLNSAPVANAGADQTPFVNDTVTLDGSRSYDVDGNLLIYSWAFTSKPANSTATLSDATAVNPTFTVDNAGTYVVSLMVNDGTVNSAADTVTISTLNSAPVANAGTDQTPYVNDTVTLDGSNSYDVDGNLLTYSWAFTSKPADSTATLSDAAAVKPTFMVDKAGMYVVSLIVNDGKVDSTTATVTISTLNSAPVANAGADQSVHVGDTATLDGSGSSDVDGNTLSYNWAFTSKPTGSTATLSNATAVNPTFTVDKAGTYVASLIVNDGMVNSAPDTITISTINVAPVANAGADQSVNVGNTATLNGGGSSDADGDAITYSWSFTTKPSGSTAALSGATSASPTFTADKAGTYVVSLIVSDGTLNSSPDTVTITANAVTINVEVKIKPETINLKSKGKFKAVIKFPESYSADTVVLATVVCGGAHAIKGKFDDDDDDNDGNRYTARFNVQDLSITASSKKEEVTLTVSGELEDGTKFTGSDTVKVKGAEKEKGKEKK